LTSSNSLAYKSEALLKKKINEFSKGKELELDRAYGFAEGKIVAHAGRNKIVFRRATVVRHAPNKAKDTSKITLRKVGMNQRAKEVTVEVKSVHVPIANSSEVEIGDAVLANHDKWMACAYFAAKVIEVNEESNKVTVEWAAEPLVNMVKTIEIDLKAVSLGAIVLLNDDEKWRAVLAKQSAEREKGVLKSQVNE
jgi:hypothetical protein